MQIEPHGLLTDRDKEPATDEEVRAAALQSMRRVSGYRGPSRANEQSFLDEVPVASRRLLDSLVTRV